MVSFDISIYKTKCIYDTDLYFKFFGVFASGDC